MTTVLVTGGTGTLGREVVARLVTRQHSTRILSHQAAPSVPSGVEVIAGDLSSGTGLREAVTGVDAIIHCASSFQSASQIDIDGTRLLLQTASMFGSPHFIYISIVGIDRSTFSYYTAKRETEVLIEQGPLPWTIVRATQFHNFVLQLIHSFGADTLPVVPVAEGVRFQSIDVGEVADGLISYIGQGPSGHTTDMGGPQVLTIEEMTKAYLHIRGKEAVIRSETLQGDLFAVFRSGINLVPAHTTGTITWEAFLHHTYDQ